MSNNYKYRSFSQKIYFLIHRKKAFHIRGHIEITFIDASIVLGSFVCPCLADEAVTIVYYNLMHYSQLRFHSHHTE